MDSKLIANREPLNLDTFPCKYIETENGQACHMELEWIDPEKLPTVSILTPTYNRKLFQSFMIKNWERIDYPRNKLEWIIVDDSDEDKKMDPSLFNKPGIRYIRVKTKIDLGKKRNFLASLANNEMLVHMDDDDYYPPENVMSRVKTIVLSEGKDCVGCVKTLCYDLIHDQTFEAYDPSNNPVSDEPSTISESSLAYTKEFWKTQKYTDTDTSAECLSFIKDRKDKIIAIPYIFVVTQLSHSDNTIKRWMLRSTKHTVQFTDNLNMMDSMLIQDLRAKIIMEFPLWKDSISFVQRNFKLNKKQFIKKLEKKPKLQNNPFIINHIRTLQSKTDCNKNIVYYCGPGKYLNFSNNWNGNTPGLGGSEEAVVNLSEQFVKLGYTVTVYNTCETESTINGVKYIQYWKWSPLDKQTLTIVWRDPSILDYSINSETVVLDLHDVIDPDWLTPERLNNATNIYCKSEFHKELLKQKNNKIRVLANGIDSKAIRKYKGTKAIRKSNIISCTSSPDRCIRALLKALPIIRAENGLENTMIYWAYGFKSGITKGGMEAHDDPEIKEWVKETKSLIQKTEGFVDLGRISHSEVVKLLKTSSIYAYGTYFPEIDCISMTKAMASGAVPIITPTGALTDKLKYFEFLEIDNGPTVVPRMNYDSLDYSISGTDFDKWVESLINQLRTNVDETERDKMAKPVLNDYDWVNISKLFLE